MSCQRNDLIFAAFSSAPQAVADQDLAQLFNRALRLHAGVWYGPDIFVRAVQRQRLLACYVAAGVSGCAGKLSSDEAGEPPSELELEGSVTVSGASVFSSGGIG